MKTILIDGVIYGHQRFGGISRWFTETLIRVGRYSGELEVILHLPEHCRGRAPEAEWIHQIRDWRPPPRRLFRGIYRPVSRARAWAMRPSVFHSTYYTSPYWSGMKVVVTVYDFIHERFPALMGDAHSLIPQKREVIERADAVIAISGSTKDDVLRYTNAQESRIVVISPGVSQSFLEASPQDKHGQTRRRLCGLGNPYWLYVGSRRLYKNFETLLRAFVRLASVTDTDLVAIGGDPNLEPRQVELLRKSGLERRVHVRRAADDEALRVAYQGATAFVCPSLAEGFGIPLLEAMACGAPVLASDIPVFRELATDAALYFDPYDDEALADAMTSVLNESTRQRMADNGRRRARDFSWHAAASRLVDVYKSLS